MPPASSSPNATSNTKVCLDRVASWSASAQAVRRHILRLSVLWLLTVGALALAYQTHFPQTISISDSDWLYASGYLRGFFPMQGSAPERYRFTDGNAAITLPAPGASLPLEITLLLNAWRPDRAGEMDLSLNGKFIKHIANFEWKTHRLVLDESVPSDPNALVIGIASDTFTPQDYDPNNPDPSTLGVRVQSITLTPKPAGAPLTLPSWNLILSVALLASGCYLASVKLNLTRAGFLLSIGLVAVLAWLIVFYRFTTATYLVPIAALLVGGYLFAAYARARKVPKLVLRMAMLGIVMLTFGSRLQLATQLPQSIDETTYVPVSQGYANAITRGRWDQIVRFKGNVEHPLLNKLSFAAAILAGRAVGISNDVFSARFVSVAASTLLAALLVLLNPFAGLFFALYTIHAQFGGLAYLEALPAFTSTLAIVAFERALRGGRRWLLLSAVMLGLTAASKYIYLVAGLAILPFLVWRFRRQPQWILAYGLVTCGTFLVSNPILWDDPIGGLRETIAYHLGYSASQGVVDANRPWYWQLLYLARVEEWSNGYAFPPDPLILIAGFLGLPTLWRTKRIYFIWFLCALLFLLIWQTKWEQYALILITPLCLAAGWGLSELARTMRTRAGSMVQVPAVESAGGRA